MLGHGGARRLRVVRRNGVADRPVLGVRGTPRRRILHMLGEALEIGVDALVEQVAHAAFKHGVAEHGGDADMEAAVEADPRIARRPHRLGVLLP